MASNDDSNNFKIKGNEALKEKRFKEAEELYTKVKLYNYLRG